MPRRSGLALAVALTALGAQSSVARADVGGGDRGDDEAERASPGPQGSWLWLDAGGGYQHVDLTTLRTRRRAGSDSLTADLIPSDASGPQIYAGAGVRFFFVTLGLRGSAAFFEDDSLQRTVGSLQLYSIDAEVGLDFLQIGRVVPSVTLGAGYSTFGGLDDAVEGVQGGLDVDGANLRAGLGVDYYLTDAFALGAQLGGDVLFLSRSGVPIRSLASPEAEDGSLIDDERAAVLRADGSSVGTTFSIVVGPSVHF